MLRVAAVDDERHALERFDSLVRENRNVEVCGLFETGAELKEYLRANRVDAVFLDIEMPEQNGMSLSEDILNIAPDAEVVFVTAYNQYALEAFEHCALDYILKPLTAKRLQKTIDRLQVIAESMRTKTNITPFVRCFGSFELYVNGKAVTWRNSKAKEALAFFVHKEGTPVDWEVVADALWPDFDCDRAHTNFHSTMYLLRKHLSEIGIDFIFECARGNYRIRTDRVQCDYYEFKQHRTTRPEGQGYMEGNAYLWAYGKDTQSE